MKLTLNPKRKLSGAALAIWLILLIFVLFIVIVGGIAITMVKTLKKIVKQPPPDDQGWVPGRGSLYGGGIVIGYTNGPGFQARTPTGFTVTNVMIYASDELYPGNDLAHWTNCIWTGPLDQLETAIGTNGMPLESWPDGQQPRQRFYNFVVKTDQ